MEMHMHTDWHTEWIDKRFWLGNAQQCRNHLLRRKLFAAHLFPLILSPWVSNLTTWMCVLYFVLMFIELKAREQYFQSRVSSIQCRRCAILSAHQFHPHPFRSCLILKTLCTYPLPSYKECQESRPTFLHSSLFVVTCGRSIYIQVAQLCSLLSIFM